MGDSRKQKIKNDKQGQRCNLYRGKYIKCQSVLDEDRGDNGGKGGWKKVNVEL